MKITVLTIFPNLFEEFVKTSVIAKIIKNGYCDLNVYDVKAELQGKNRIDDTPYGGGSGMVLKIEPWVSAIERFLTKESYVILMSPQGKSINSELISNFHSYSKDLIILCGHYEGFDERITNFIDQEVSIGDYILTGGEIPAMVLLEIIMRSIPGAIKSESLTNESFINNLLDYPSYTRPADFRGYKVPEVLMSGNHALIQDYRINIQKAITLKKRPDLYRKYLKKLKLGDTYGKK